MATKLNDENDTKLLCPYPEEPEQEILFLSQGKPISVAREGVPKQPETKCTSENVDVFLHSKSSNHMRYRYTLSKLYYNYRAFAYDVTA